MIARLAFVLRTARRTCDDLLVEAERRFDEGHAGAASLIFNRVAETCINGRQSCPENGSRRVAAERVARRLRDAAD
jgi:hypothetical protein